MRVDGQSGHGLLSQRRLLNPLAHGQDHEPTTTTDAHGLVAVWEKAKKASNSNDPILKEHAHMVGGTA